MKLIKVKATETEPATINLLTDNGNKFASVDHAKNIRVFGEDMKISISEAKVMLDISDNFELYFNNIKNQ